MQYASFWKRTAAYLIDSIIYGIIVGLINNILGLVLALSVGINNTPGNEPPLSDILTVLGILICAQLAAYVAYYVWPETSSWQGTIGKKILGLQVTDLQGRRISFIRSLWRHVAMLFSAIILCIGYLMCFWTERKQCLHDQLADCLVMDTKPNEKHGCIIGIFVGLFAFFILLFVGGIIAAISIPQFAKAEEKARTVQALSWLHTTRNLQLVYEMEHGQPASRWDELSFDRCPTHHGNTCTLSQYTLVLGSDGVTLKHKSGAYDYDIFLAYHTQDTQRDLLCIARNETSRRFCEHTLLLPTQRQN